MVGTTEVQLRDKKKPPWQPWLSDWRLSHHRLDKPKKFAHIFTTETSQPQNKSSKLQVAHCTSDGQNQPVQLMSSFKNASQRSSVGPHSSKSATSTFKHSLCAEKAAMHLYCTLLHDYKHRLCDTCTRCQSFCAPKGEINVATLCVHLVRDAHVGTESRLTSRFRPLVFRFVRFSFRSQGDTMRSVRSSLVQRCISRAKWSVVATQALLHPQLLPPTSYYQMTFNPSASRRFRAILHLSATMWVFLYTPLQISGNQILKCQLQFAI